MQHAHAGGSQGWAHEVVGGRVADDDAAPRSELQTAFDEPRNTGLDLPPADTCVELVDRLFDSVDQPETIATDAIQDLRLPGDWKSESVPKSASATPR